MSRTSHPRLRGLALAWALAVLPSARLRAQAAITWGSASQITGDSDVKDDGTVVWAYNLTNTDSGSFTINGVTFQNDAGSNSNLTFTTAAGSGFYENGGAFAGPALDSLSSNYQTLLSSADYWDPVSGYTGNPDTITLNNLTAGQNYQIEVWVNDSRGPYNSRVVTLEDGSGDSLALKYSTASGNASGLGQYVTATFTATGSSEAIYVYPGASEDAQINAIDLEDMSAVPEPRNCALIGGAAALLFACYRKRTRSLPLPAK